MYNLFRRKTRIELLKERYRSLMKRSFELSVKNPEKSEKAHQQADKLLQEIQYLSIMHADK
ncbi:MULTISPECIES: Lacal_2735 family protein [Aequorivita]|uniref:Lacal_2735 family protein n=2 Tax=Aequorivita TaxID=153265 RepID=A0AB35YR88_9FLAO|nr:Lacal_2735 family protein [Aequorivita sp. Ant34-E75]WGF91191.1 Lacal_2735 family protein [Aequorivita sp. Ant34-E75]